MLLLETISAGGESWSIFNMIAQLFFIVAILIFVVVLAYYFTKWVASAKHIRKGPGNMKIVESLGLGFQNGIHLVQVGKKYVLLGITKDRITFLCELSESDIEPIQGEAVPSFENYLSRIINRNRENNTDE